MNRKSVIKTNRQKYTFQLIPIGLTVVTFFILWLGLYEFVKLLNFFPLSERISYQIRFLDFIVGLTIYLKTSIDFALFIGRQMSIHPGWKNRIILETGTALGNGLGTLLVLLIWTFFKEVPLLLLGMILIAALVLFQLAQESLEDFFQFSPAKTIQRIPFLPFLFSLLKSFNTPIAPFLSKILPIIKSKNKIQMTPSQFFLYALSIPFILGLDDFAGYIPLFNVLNIFGFSIGVFFGHMILNLLIFASPKTTTQLVKQPVIQLFGSIAFLGIGTWGIFEAGSIAYRLLFR